jgi:hypothetical protein
MSVLALAMLAVRARAAIVNGILIVAPPGMICLELIVAGLKEERLR